jgi:hypothetical protein
MRTPKIAALALVLTLASPGLAAAQEALAAGAITGALTGALLGGPIGAAVGGLAGAAIRGVTEADHPGPQSLRTIPAVSRSAGAAPRQRPAKTDRSRIAHTYPDRRRGPVRGGTVQRPQLALAVVERTCVRDRAGNQTCREVTR